MARVFNTPTWPLSFSRLKWTIEAFHVDPPFRRRQRATKNWLFWWKAPWKRYHSFRSPSCFGRRKVVFQFLVAVFDHQSAVIDRTFQIFEPIEAWKTASVLFHFFLEKWEVMSNKHWWSRSWNPSLGSLNTRIQRDSYPRRLHRTPMRCSIDWAKYFTNRALANLSARDSKSRGIETKYRDKKSVLAINLASHRSPSESKF